MKYKIIVRKKGDDRFRKYTSREIEERIIAETNKHTEFRPIEVNNRFYSCRIFKPKTGLFIYEEFKYEKETWTETPGQCSNEDHLKCPECGYVNKFFELPEEDSGHNCLTCGSLIKYYTEVTRTFIAETVKKTTPLKLTPVLPDK